MKQNEIDFINLIYTEYIIGKNSSQELINRAYTILNGIEPTDNCVPCIKSRWNQLKNTYITLIKIKQPELIKKQSIKNEVKDTTKDI